MANCWNAAERARIRALIATKEAQLNLLNATYNETATKEIHSYRFDSGEGSQQATRRKLNEISGEITKLEAEIRRLYRRLECGGLKKFVLRRAP